MEFTGMRVLVLEDEYLIGLDLERIADECGARSVHLTTNIIELQAWIDSNPACDLAILEMQAHGISSLGPAGVLRRRGIPIVFTTAYENERGAVPGFPGAPVVSKPYGKSQIVRAAQAALAKAPDRSADDASGELV